MKFQEVIAQQSVKSRLVNLVDSERIPHALMINGAEGSGGLPMALALSSYIMCDNKSAGDACGVCPSCVKTFRHIHPDVHFTFPVVTRKANEIPTSSIYMQEWRSALAANTYMSVNDWLNSINAENKQGNITVKECHEIIRNMSIKTFESPYKIQIIWLAEYLKEAGNTLLKIIEEPPLNTIFILIVENTETVLTTLISRTQLIKLQPLSDSEIADALVNQYQLERDTALQIARVSDGNFNMATKYIDGDVKMNDVPLRKWLLCCFNLKAKHTAENLDELIAWIEEISKTGRENQKLFLKYALFFLGECLSISGLGKSDRLMGEELDFANRFASRYSPEQFGALATLFSDMHYHIERNANPKILFLSNSFRISEILSGQLAEVV